MSDMDEEQKKIFKDTIKEALREWLDEKYAVFGQWSFHALMAAALVAMVYFILKMDGWHR